MRVLVTGATGFVGGRLVRVLRERGDDVVASVRTPSDHLAQLGVEQVVGDLAGIDAVPGAIDAVVHTAASMAADLELARSVNRDGTRAVAAVARRAGAARFVHVSTTSVYDLQAVGDGVVDERAPLLGPGAPAPAVSSSSSTYALTKVEAEAEAAAAAADGLPTTVLRPPAVFGTGPTSTWGTRIPTRLRDGAWQPPHPATTMGWVHVDDLVTAMVAAVDRPVDAAVNVVGGHATFGRYVDEVAQLVPGIDRGLATAAADHDRKWSGSYATGRLGDLLGVAPRWSFEDTMAELAAWWATTSDDG